jgi:hypothetical protein
MYNVLYDTPINEDVVKTIRKRNAVKNMLNPDNWEYTHLPNVMPPRPILSGGSSGNYGGMQNPKYLLAGTNANYPQVNMHEAMHVSSAGAIHRQHPVRCHMCGGYSFGDFTRDLGHGAKAVYNEVAPIAKDVGKDLLKDAIKGYMNKPKEGGKRRGRPPKRGGVMVGQNGHGIAPKEIMNEIVLAPHHTPMAVPSISGGKRRGRPRKTGGDFWGDVWSGVKSVGKELAPVVKDVGKDLLVSGIKGLATGAGKRRGRPSKKALEGGYSIQDFGKDLGSVAKEVAPIAIPLMMGLGRKKGARSKTHKGELDYTTKKGDVAYHEKGHDVKKAHKPYDGRAKRGEIVKKVMKEKGLSLAQASKYVKEHGLYK